MSATALFHFNQTGAYGFVANLLAIPWTSFVIRPVLVLALLLDPLGVAVPAWWTLGKAMSALIAFAIWVAGWPGSVVRLGLMPVTAYALLFGGGQWLFIWQGRVRWFGAVPVVVGAVIALTAHPPDLLVSADGHHVAVLLDAYDDDGPRLALLRDRTGDYLRDVWGGVTASTADAVIADLPQGNCTVDACVARIRRDAARSGFSRRCRRTASQPRFGPSCAAADIVVSDRPLPDWCTPRWLKLDRTVLGTNGTVTIWRSPRRVETVGDHPWMPQPQVWRPRPAGTSGEHQRSSSVVPTPDEPGY